MSHRSSLMRRKIPCIFFLRFLRTHPSTRTAAVIEFVVGAVKDSDALATAWAARFEGAIGVHDLVW